VKKLIPLLIAFFCVLIAVLPARAQITITSLTPQVNAGMVLMACETDMLDGATKNDYLSVQSDCTFHSVFQGIDNTQTSIIRSNPVAKGTYQFVPSIPGTMYYAEGSHYLWLNEFNDGLTACDDANPPIVYLYDPLGYVFTPGPSGGNTFTIPLHLPAPPHTFWCVDPSSPTADGDNYIFLGSTNSAQVSTMQIDPHNPAPISAGESVTFHANEPEVTWSVSPAIGQIPGGVYTAPATVTADQTITITAQNAHNPNDKDSITLSLKPLTITVDPPLITLNQGQTATFTATIEGNNNLNATWVPTGGGSVNPATGPSTTYTAPGPITSSPVILTASSVADANQKDTATITLLTTTTSVSSPGSIVGVTPNTPVNLSVTLSSVAPPPATQPVCAWTVTPTSLGTFSDMASCSLTQFTVTSSIAAPTQVTFTACNSSVKPAACGSANTTLVPGVSISGISGTWAAGQNNNIVSINGTGFGTSPVVHLSDSTITARIVSNTNTSIQLSVDIPLAYQLETIAVSVTANVFGTSSLTSAPVNVNTSPAHLTMSLVQSSAQLTEGQQFQFVPKITCTLNNGLSCGVPQTADWAITAGADIGSVNATGLFQVTGTGISANRVVSGAACASVNAQACSSFTVTVQPTNITVSPAVAAVPVGTSKQFTAALQNAPYSGGVQNANVNWSLNPSGFGAGTITAAGLYTAPETVPPDPVTVKACSQVDNSRCGTALVSFSVVPDFVVMVTPDSQTVSAGSTTPARYQLSVTPINGFVGNVSFAVSGLPPGTSSPFFSPPISFDTTNNSVPQTSTLSFTAGATTTIGSYHFIITASGGGQSHTVTQSNGSQLILVVGQADFTLAVNPVARTAAAGSSASYNVTVTPSGGFSGTVNLTMAGTLPTGVTATFDPRSISGSGSSMLTLATSPTTASGTYTLAVNAASGALNKNQTITLGVPCPTCPGIQNITPGTGVVNTAVAITGFGFGDSQGSSTLTFNHIPGVIQTWTDTVILATVPTGASTGPVVVTVNGQPSNQWPFTITCALNCAPTINGITPNTGAVNSVVTISGLGFGATQGSNVVNFSQMANGVVLMKIPATATDWSDNSITATVPSGATSGGVTVTTPAGTSNIIFFNLLASPCTPNCAPVVDNITSDRGGLFNLTPGVSHVFIAGHGFGATKGQSKVTFNGVLGTTSEWSDTEIDALVPASTTTGYIVVTVGGRSSNPVSYTTSGDPVCTSNCSIPAGQVSLDISYVEFDQYVPANTTFDYRTIYPGITTGSSFPFGSDLVPYNINNFTNSAMDMTPAEITSQTCSGHFTTDYTRFNSDGTPNYFRVVAGASFGSFSFNVVQDTKKCTAVLTFQYRTVSFDAANHETDGPVQTYAITLNSGPAAVFPDPNLSIAATDSQRNLVAVGIRNPDGSEIPGSGVASLGAMAPGNLVKVPLTIYNTTFSHNINLDGISIQSAQGHGLFSIASFPAQIAPNQHGVVQIQLDDRSGATAAGTYTAKVYGHYFDPFGGAGTGNLFYIPVTVTIQDGPHATVYARGPNTEIPNGNTFTLPAVVAGKARPQVFDIVNTGNQPLTISNPVVDGDGFSITVPLNNTTIPGHQSVADVGGPNTGAFRVRSLHATPGTYRATVTFNSTATDGTVTPYKFYLSSLVRPRPNSASVVSAEQGTTVLANGDSFDPTQPTLFAVMNDGDVPLSLSNLTLPTGYSLVTPLPPSVDASDVAWFEVAYSSATGGALSFGTSDPATPVFQLMAPAQAEILFAGSDMGTSTDGLPADINVLANDIDPAGRTLVVTNPGVVPPIYGSVRLMPGNIIRYTPLYPMDGNDSFIYEISNGVSTSRATVSIKLVVAHHPPVAADDVVYTTPGTPITIDVLANDYSPDTGAVVLTYNTIVTPPQHGTAQHGADWNTILYTPNPGYLGSDFFVYQITDTHGGFATAAVGIGIELPNYPPVAMPDSATTYINQAINIPVTANDSDPDGDPVKVLSVITPPAIGRAVLVDPYTIRYTPTPYTAGTDTFTYQVYDGHRHTATAQVTVSVLNHPPVAVADVAQTNSSTPININVVANDTDPEQDPISLSSTPLLSSPASGATVTYIDSNTLRYTPKFGFVGTDTFTYQIQDLRGAKATGTVSVTVVNRPPVAINDPVSTPFNTPVTINVLQNDNDPDGHVLSLSSTPVVVAPAAGATITVSGNSLIYTPPPGFVGTDSFQYEMQDSYGAKARATVTVSIINRAPIAVADTFTVIGSNTTQLAVLANDSDPDGEPITLVNNFVNPLHGTLTIDSYKFVDYKATGCYVGVDMFKYYVQDSRGATTQGTATVNVVTDHLPVAVADNVTTPSGTFTTINVTANDCHPDGQKPYLDVNFPLYVQPAHGYIQLADNTTFYYTSFTGYHGTDTFQYNLRDAAGHYTVGTVTITIP
jgi:hypothetical protein